MLRKRYELESNFAFWTLVTVFLAYGFLTLCAIWFAPPLSIHHDEYNFVFEGLRLLGERKLIGYTHGPLPYELAALVEGVVFISLRILGIVHSPVDFISHMLVHQGAYFLIFRIITAFAGLLLLLQVYRLGKFFLNPTVGALTALFLGTNFTFIVMSSFYKEDVFYWLFLITSVLAALNASKEQTLRNILLSGVALGAAVATKYLAIFSVPLVLIPLFFSQNTDRRYALKQSVLISCIAVATFLILMPFIFTDTKTVFETINKTHIELSNPELHRLGHGELLLFTYLFKHIPDLVGWIFFGAAILEAVIRIKQQPRGPILLAIVALGPFAFLCAHAPRLGFSIGYYIVPLGIFILILGCSFAIRMMNSTYKAFLRPIIYIVGLVTLIFSNSFLSGSLKYALVLTAPDVRILARDYFLTQAPEGSRVLITAGMHGHNFFGPPLVSLDPPQAKGIFGKALTQANSIANTRRYHVDILNYTKLDLSAEQLKNFDWIITIYDPRNDGDQNSLALIGFELTRVFQAFPEQRSIIAPLATAEDIAEYRNLSIFKLWSQRVRGHTIRIYRKS